MKLFFKEPEFFPPLEFFHGLVHSNLWVVVDHLHYVVRSRQNRCRIRTRSGVQLLSVRVKRPCSSLPLCNIMIDNWQPWKRRFLKSIERNYGETEYYDDLVYDLKYHIEAPNVLLETLNVQTILWIAKLLDTQCDLIFTKNYPAMPKCEVVNYFCDKLNGSAFNKQFLHPFYKQRYEPFEKNLSMLDALLCLGVKETKRLLK